MSRVVLLGFLTVSAAASPLAAQDGVPQVPVIVTVAGRAVDRILRIDDGRQPRGGMPVPMRMVRGAVAGDVTATSIEAGLIDVHAQVTLTVSIK